MTIEELRIGNLVYCKTDNGEKIGRICMIQDYFFSADVKDGKSYKNYVGKIYEGINVVDCISPIPITEETLVKNSFELTKKTAIKNVRLPIKIIDRYVYIRKVDDINIEFDENRLFINNDLFTEALLFEDVKYIHEIQNAYQLLTKKELKIEL